MTKEKNNLNVPKNAASDSLPSGGTLLSSSNPVEEDTALLKETFKEKYKWGFVTDIEADATPTGNCRCALPKWVTCIGTK